MAMSLQDKLAYSGELYRALQPLFISCIPAEEFTDIPIISNKLTASEIESVRQKGRNEGCRSAARLLLDYLYRKPDWFESVWIALQSPYVRLSDVMPQFLSIKAQVDRAWQANRAKSSQLKRVVSMGDNVYEEAQPSSPLQSQLWYAGTMDRSKADALLEKSKAGTFLVRYNKDKRYHSLYVRGYSTVNHLKINDIKQLNGAIMYHLDVLPDGFDSIESLVAHYSTHGFMTNDEQSPIALIYPAPVKQNLGDCELPVNGWRGTNMRSKSMDSKSHR